MSQHLRVLAVGISYKTADITVREKFSVGASNSEGFERRLSDINALKEFVVLSTCNRTEVYCLAEGHGAEDLIANAMSRHSGVAPEEMIDHLYMHYDGDAVRHLFKVASGVESMALGETEILGQVKDAYLRAHSLGLTGKYLNTLFQRALKTGKKTRTHTAIGTGKVSVASISVDLAGKIFSSLRQKRVLLIGSGQVARQVCESLVSHGVRDIIIANRNIERAEGLVEEFGGRSVPFAEIDRHAPGCDIVISSAGSPKAIIHADRVTLWRKGRHRQSIFLIDLGVPRNIDNNVNELSDVYLYNLDDLKSIADQNIKGRQAAVEECRDIIEDATDRLMSWIAEEDARSRAVGS